jgi:hypothetical protein
MIECGLTSFICRPVDNSPAFVVFLGWIFAFKQRFANPIK